MEAKELRIGNYVMWKGSKIPNRICEVVQIRRNNIHTLPVSLGLNMDDYLPIPLTEEWLKSAGFEKEQYTWNLKKTNCRITPQKAMLDGWDIFIHHSKEDHIHLLRIDHVHQLQNLYFALTNTELEFKTMPK